MSGGMVDFDQDKIQAINASIYDGVAVPMIGAYNSDKLVATDFSVPTKRILKNSRKHVWPWVFLNRIIGYEEHQPSHSPLADQPYFRNIQGMAIDEGSQPLKDFHTIWSMALSSAKEMGAPGIVVDIETYNNYRSNRLAYVMSKTNMGKTHLIARLKQIGAHLYDIVDTVYPEAVIWFLYTGIGSPLQGKVSIKKEYRPGSYIVFGFLEQSNRKKSSMILVSGGEKSLGYCNKNLRDLKARITHRNQIFEYLLAQFPQLKLGGTIAPWHDKSIRKKWMLEYEHCSNSTLNTAESFRPLLERLIASYSYVWVYAAGAAGYNPYDKTIAEIYNKAFDCLPNASCDR